MTAFRCIETVTTLRCGRETRPPVDGMRTYCGTPYVHDGPVQDALWVVRNAGWLVTGAAVYCPEHAIARREGSSMNEFNPGDGWREVPPEDRRAEVQWYGNPAGLDPVKAWVRVPPVPLPTAPYTVIRVTWRAPTELLTGDELMLDIDGMYWRDGDDEIAPEVVAERITGFEVLAEPRAVTAKAVLDRVRDELQQYRGAPLLDALDAIARDFGVES